MTELFPDDAAAAKREAARLERERKKLEQRLREHEADFTGRIIARRCLAAGWLAPGEHPPPPALDGAFALGGTGGDEFRILDLGAGPGVWSSEAQRLAQRLGIKVHITAVELRLEERPWLRRNAHEVIIGDWRLAFDCGQTYDLVIGNPPFTEARAPVRLGLDPKRRAPKAMIDGRLRELVASGLTDDENTLVHAEALAKYDPHESMVAVALRHAPAVFLYLSQQGWTKTASGWLTRLYYPPAATYDVPGSISHREGRAADSISYAASLWLRGHAGPAATYMLRPFASRSWKIRPGTEPDSYYDEHGIPLLVRGVS